MTAPYLKVSANSRYLVDGNNGDAPFLLAGEAGWELATNCSLTEVGTYLDDRQGRGFNSIIVEAIEHWYAPSARNPTWANKAGDSPFDSGNNFDKPTEAYWAFIDSLVDAAATRGMVIFLFPAYLGFPATQQGWYDVMVTNGVQKMRTFGRYIGNRYKTRDNIVWVLGGDRDPANKELVRQIAYGIIETDKIKPKLICAHTQGSVSGTGEGLGEYLEEAWIQVNTSYASDQTVYSKVRTAYQRAMRKPVFHIEGTYADASGATRQKVRREFCWALLQGAVGLFYGEGPTWWFGTISTDGNPGWSESPSAATNFPNGWTTSLGTNTVQDVARIWALFTARAWYKLTPDDSHVTVTSGFGTDGATSYCTVGYVPDGSLVMVYVPTATSPVVNMNKMRGTTNVRRWDPTTGTFTTLNGSAANSGTLTLTHPGNNSGGDADWVWVLEA